MSVAAPEPDPLEQAAESFLARLRAGERPSLDEYEAKHPQLAADIRTLFPALALLEEGRRCVGQPPAPDPAHLGRYRVEKLLGQGGFGRVYLAYDEPLRRPVAVKVPRPDRAALPGTPTPTWPRRASWPSSSTRTSSPSTTWARPTPACPSSCPRSSPGSTSPTR
jgi:hypothetical protein